ncbi:MULTISPECIES: MoaD/ThiS family protein [Comamonas]|uniref:MoaD/ThiS family protein n=1 Tax=Comamonas flocculans TaxID=2597701 RepID=A0A5B8RW42_9BURK|nr:MULTISPECIES: MoaD/ThiS family protein [Comamonas]QEA13710.1 MoaD/ThiS family protein [Comamonas flocculans]QXL85724.1 MoaD/ThiS family protein [Comamonas sp. NLF-1-9]
MTAKTVTVRYFASIREGMGRERESVSTRAQTLAALRQELIARGAPWADCLAEGRALRMALDQAMAGADAPLPDGAEVAFFPPVTGG